MKKILILSLILFTACSNIQLVQQNPTNTNQPLPVTTEHSLTDMPDVMTDSVDAANQDTEITSDTSEAVIESYNSLFRVIETWPLDQSADITLDKPIEIFFSKDVTIESLNAENVLLSLESNLRYYEGDPFKFILLNYDPEQRLLVINSGAYDLYGEKIKVTLTDNITNTFNEPLSPYTFSFTVKPPDELPPFQVFTTDPQNNDTFVVYQADPGIRISYTNEVDQTTINENTVTITLPFSYNYSATAAIPFEVRIDYAKQSSFLSLDPEKTYNGETVKIELSDGIKDIYNQSLAPYTMEFTIKQ